MHRCGHDFTIRSGQRLRADVAVAFGGNATCQISLGPSYTSAGS
jgi:hypothetical protein